MSANAHTAPQAAPDTTALIPLRPTDSPATGPAPLLTPRKQAEFCRALAGHGNVRLACRAVAVSPQTAYRARRASAQFRQCWDAAIVIAREHVEQVLADRAINGVEEKVFYHGEEVATRRRYDSRLLLAHLARLDRKADEGAFCDECGVPLLDEDQFDQAVAVLEDDGDFVPGQCSRCSTLTAEDARSSAGMACPDCGGRCLEAEDDPEVELTEDDCMWLDSRLIRMEAARPSDTPLPCDLPGGDPDGEVAMLQLAAFEAGEARWWEIVLPPVEGEEPAR